MFKRNYINYQEILKDGSYCEINSYSKIKKLLKSIGRNIKKRHSKLANILYIILAEAPFVLFFASIIGLVFGGVMLFITPVIGAIMVVTSLVVLLAFCCFATIVILW